MALRPLRHLSPGRPTTITMKVELCSFSGYKIYPGHGRRYARTDGKVKAGWAARDAGSERTVWCLAKAWGPHVGWETLVNLGGV